MLQASAMESANHKRHIQQIQQIQQQSNAALVLAAERENTRLESRERPIAAIQVITVVTIVSAMVCDGS